MTRDALQTCEYALEVYRDQLQRWLSRRGSKVLKADLAKQLAAVNSALAEVKQEI